MKATKLEPTTEVEAPVEEVESPASTVEDSAEKMIVIGLPAIRGRPEVESAHQQSDQEDPASEPEVESAYQQSEEDPASEPEVSGAEPGKEVSVVEPQQLQKKRVKNHRQGRNIGGVAPAKVPKNVE